MPQRHFRLDGGTAPQHNLSKTKLPVILAGPPICYGIIVRLGSSPLLPSLSSRSFGDMIDDQLAITDCIMVISQTCRFDSCCMTSGGSNHSCWTEHCKPSSGLLSSHSVQLQCPLGWPTSIDCWWSKIHDELHLIDWNAYVKPLFVSLHVVCGQIHFRRWISQQPVELCCWPPWCHSSQLMICPVHCGLHMNPVWENCQWRWSHTLWLLIVWWWIYSIISVPSDLGSAS